MEVEGGGRSSGLDAKAPEQLQGSKVRRRCGLVDQDSWIFAEVWLVIMRIRNCQKCMFQRFSPEVLVVATNPDISIMKG